MLSPELKLCLIFTLLLASFSTPLYALDIDQLNWNETMEKWGQVLFCQRIYNRPEVQSRLYNFDVEQCDKAGQLMSNVAARYPAQEQVQLKNQAERHALALSKNTAEPYHAVPACRTYCRELADTLDKRNER